MLQSPKSLLLLLIVFVSSFDSYANTSKKKTLYDYNYEKQSKNYELAKKIKFEPVSSTPFHTAQNIGTNPSKQALSAPYNSAQNVNPVLGLILVVAFIVFGIYVAVRVRRLLKEEKY